MEIFYINLKPFTKFICNKWSRPTPAAHQYSNTSLRRSVTISPRLQDRSSVWKLQQRVHSPPPPAQTLAQPRKYPLLFRPRVPQNETQESIPCLHLFAIAATTKSYRLLCIVKELGHDYYQIYDSMTHLRNENGCEFFTGRSKLHFIEPLWILNLRQGFVTDASQNYLAHPHVQQNLQRDDFKGLKMLLHFNNYKWRSMSIDKINQSQNPFISIDGNVQFNCLEFNLRIVLIFFTYSKLIHPPHHHLLNLSNKSKLFKKRICILFLLGSFKSVSIPVLRFLTTSKPDKKVRYANIGANHHHHSGDLIAHVLPNKLLLHFVV